MLIRSLLITHQKILAVFIHPDLFFESRSHDQWCFRLGLLVKKTNFGYSVLPRDVSSLWLRPRGGIPLIKSVLQSVSRLVGRLFFWSVSCLILRRSVVLGRSFVCLVGLSVDCLVVCLVVCLAVHLVGLLISQLFGCRSVNRMSVGRSIYLSVGHSLGRLFVLWFVWSVGQSFCRSFGIVRLVGLSIVQSFELIWGLSINQSVNQLFEDQLFVRSVGRLLSRSFFWIGQTFVWLFRGWWVV